MASSGHAPYEKLSSTDISLEGVPSQQSMHVSMLALMSMIWARDFLKWWSVLLTWGGRAPDL